MSRIGKMPVPIPSGVKLTVEGSSLRVEGEKGKLEERLAPEVGITLEDKRCLVTRRDDTKRSRAMHGLYRKLIWNMVTGVSTGFTKVLLVNGVGYRAEMREKTLVLNLGYSNPIEYPTPDGVTIAVEGNNRISVSGADRQRIGQTCAEIRAFRPPEPYKGKGIRYENEHVRRKVGKTGVK